MFMAMGGKCGLEVGKGVKDDNSEDGSEGEGGGVCVKSSSMNHWVLRVLDMEDGVYKWEGVW